MKRVRAGDLSTRVEEGAADEELSSLTRAFNRMTSQLSSQRNALVDANRQLDQRRRSHRVPVQGGLGAT